MRSIKHSSIISQCMHRLPPHMAQEQCGSYLDKHVLMSENKGVDEKCAERRVKHIMCGVRIDRVVELCVGTCREGGRKGRREGGREGGGGGGEREQ